MKPTARDCKYRSVSQTATYFGCTRDTVLTLIHDGSLPCVDLSSPESRREKYMIGEDDIVILEERRRYRPVGEARKPSKRLIAHTYGAGDVREYF